ncbi:MAG: hypothetical protein K2X27_08875 [Candidatus Obscuribacterales bacterium]|nr:hypothetical protein [Candidatus Obscuribacterales bacterium]
MRARIFAVFLVLAVNLWSNPCQAQFLKKLSEELLQGQSNQQNNPASIQSQGSPAGNTNLPPGQYMMTNMNTGQGFYIMVNGNGQMFASIPGSGQNLPTQSATPPMVPGSNPALNQPATQNGVGGFMKGALNNFLQNQLSPQNPPPQ